MKLETVYSLIKSNRVIWQNRNILVIEMDDGGVGGAARSCAWTIELKVRTLRNNIARFIGHPARADLSLCRE